jgi:hypothetical protein
MSKILKSCSIRNSVRSSINIEKLLKAFSIPYLFFNAYISKSIPFLKKEYFEHKECIGFLSSEFLVVPYFPYNGEEFSPWDNPLHFFKKLFFTSDFSTGRE